MGFNEFIGKLFGNKATRDMKEIKPWVDKVKAVYPEISKLSNDELRARTEELKKYIKASAVEEQKRIEELKATIETTEIEQREPIFAQIDKLEKEVLEKYEKALDDVHPQAFAIVKDTARRFTENAEIEVTATDLTVCWLLKVRILFVLKEIKLSGKTIGLPVETICSGPWFTMMCSFSGVPYFIRVRLLKWQQVKVRHW